MSTITAAPDVYDALCSFIEAKTPEVSEYKLTPDELRGLAATFASLADLRAMVDAGDGMNLELLAPHADALQAFRDEIQEEIGRDTVGRARRAAGDWMCGWTDDLEADLRQYDQMIARRVDDAQGLTVVLKALGRVAA